MKCHRCEKEIPEDSLYSPKFTDHGLTLSKLGYYEYFNLCDNCKKELDDFKEKEEQK